MKKSLLAGLVCGLILIFGIIIAIGSTIVVSDATVNLTDIGSMNNLSFPQKDIESPFKIHIESGKPIQVITNSLFIKLKTPELLINLKTPESVKSLNSSQEAAINRTLMDLNNDIKSNGGHIVKVYKHFGVLNVKLGDPQAPPIKLNLTSDAIRTFDSNTNNSIPDKLTIPNNFKKALETNPAVEAIFLDAIIPLNAQTIPTGVNRIDADRSPANSGDGTGMTRADIAILDTGVDVNHPDLNVVRCISFVGNPDTVDIFTGEDIEDPPLNNCKDTVGHGTHVAGIAAAKDNDIGVVGTAPGANIFAIKVCGEDDCRISDILEGLNYVTSHYYEIDVVNMSFGGKKPNWFWDWFIGSDLVEDAITTLVKTYNVVVVVSAGNEHENAQHFTPARTPAAITVSAMADHNGKCGGDKNIIWDDLFAYFSNFGSVVDLAAPGFNILSTTPVHIVGLLYDDLSGTSMSAPHVAGAAALYLSLNPSATHAEVEQYLKSTGTKPPNKFKEPLGFSCDGNGRGYFLSQYDGDNIREPLLYMGWGAPICPPDCQVEPSRDSDRDGVTDLDDNCPSVVNADQKDIDGDGTGDLCDPDVIDSDQDGIVDSRDNCPSVVNADQNDSDGDGTGNLCDPDVIDVDYDGVMNTSDNCPFKKNPNQSDVDDDGTGDVCDSDIDNDRKLNVIDNCPYDYNPDQKDSDHDRIGDACDVSE